MMLTCCNQQKASLFDLDVSLLLEAAPARQCQFSLCSTAGAQHTKSKQSGTERYRRWRGGASEGRYIANQRTFERSMLTRPLQCISRMLFST